jgi:hypothetical protein
MATMTYSRVIRLSYILAALTVVALIGVFAQQAQIREMRRVDCAAYLERMDRVKLYDALVDRLATRDGDLAAAYERQRESVRRAAEAGENECD